jgi:hypothetical protein
MRLPGENLLPNRRLRLKASGCRERLRPLAVCSALSDCRDEAKDEAESVAVFEGEVVLDLTRANTVETRRMRITER